MFSESPIVLFLTFAGHLGPLPLPTTCLQRSFSLVRSFPISIPSSFDSSTISFSPGTSSLGLPVLGFYFGTCPIGPQLVQTPICYFLRLRWHLLLRTGFEFPNVIFVLYHPLLLILSLQILLNIFRLNVANLHFIRFWRGPRTTYTQSC